MSKCAIKSCESTETTRIYLKNQKDNSGRPIQLVIDICDACCEKVAESFKCSYYRCGGLAFVNEVFECENKIC